MVSKCLWGTIQIKGVYLGALAENLPRAHASPLIAVSAAAQTAKVKSERDLYEKSPPQKH